MAKKHSTPAASERLASAIVHETRDGKPLPTAVHPDDLVDNPDNWRLHPQAQLDSIAGSIVELGWIAGATVNLRLPEDGWSPDARPTMIDGHGRVKIARQRGEAAVPVTWVRLTPEQERKALVYFDPITSLAEGSAELFARLTDSMTTDNVALQALVADTYKNLAGNLDLEPQADPEEDAPTDDVVPSRFVVMVQCADETQQAALLERLIDEGYDCRALVS